jgi:hypothetical protein
MNNFYVYRYIRLDTNTPFYVGKGKNYRAANINNHNKYCKRIAKSYGYKIEYILNKISENLAFAKEIEFIALYKSYGYCEANFTDGGEGPSGYKHTEEVKKKISIALNKPEIKAKMSEITRKLHQDPEFRKKTYNAQRIAQNRPEVKAKISKASKKIQNTPEAKAKRSEISKEIYKNLMFKEKHRELIKIAQNKPETIIKKSKTMKKKWKNIKFRKKITKASQEGQLKAKAKIFNAYKAICIQKGNKYQPPIYEKGNYIGTYYNKSICAENLNICSKHIPSVLNNKRPQHRGYIFEYQTVNRN